MIPTNHLMARAPLPELIARQASWPLTVDDGSEGPCPSRIAALRVDGANGRVLARLPIVRSDLSDSGHPGAWGLRGTHELLHLGESLYEKLGSLTSIAAGSVIEMR